MERGSKEGRRRRRGVRPVMIRGGRPPLIMLMLYHLVAGAAQGSVDHQG